ncbi:hypothetical protein HYV43_04020 [Candidatus Micrarchaeota archaeon]|nr:hypothetical protein [Candidatus Micrarchaeota archaeon]
MGFPGGADLRLALFDDSLWRQVVFVQGPADAASLVWPEGAFAEQAWDFESPGEDDEDVDLDEYAEDEDEDDVEGE